MFRQAPDRLVFNTVTALQGKKLHALLTHSRSYTNNITISTDIYLNPGIRKASNYSQTQFNEQTNIFGTLEKDTHRQKRNIYARVLSDRSLRTFEPTMSHEIEVFLRQMVKHDGKPVNMSPQCERLTADVAGQLAFGQPLNTQTEETNRIFPQAMSSMNAIVSLFSKSKYRKLITSLGLLSHWNQD